MSSSARPKFRRNVAQQVEHLGLHGDVERGGRLVRDEEHRIAGQGRGDEHPLPLSAGQLVRVVAGARGGVRDPDGVEQRDGAPPGFGLRRLPVDDEGLGDLVADGEHRVERGHRLLEDEADTRAADRRAGRARRAGQVASVEEHGRRR